jgi:hypothetical protein
MAGRVSGTVTAICFCMIAVAEPAAANPVAHFPPPDEPWTARHYVDFYFAHYNGNRALPHLRTGPTAEVFERIVDRDNIARILAGPSTSDEKRRNLEIILATLGEIRAAYNYALFVGEPLQEELSRIQAFTLFVMDRAIALASAGRACSSACGTALRTVVDSLSRRDVFSKEQMLSLTAALAKHYPGIGPVLSMQDRQELKDELGLLAAREEDPALREAQRRVVRMIAAP